MRILFVTTSIPYPPDNGIRIVSYNAMRLMKEKGHELVLAVLSDETWNLEERLNHMANICKEIKFVRLAPKPKGFLLVKTLMGHLYFMERYADNSFKKHLYVMINQFKPSCIHFDTILMTQYRQYVPDQIRTVASINDSYTLALQEGIASGQYTGIEKWYRQWQFTNSRDFETNFYPKFNAVHIMSDVDARYLKNLNPNINTVVIPNGVHEELFSVPSPDFSLPSLIMVADWGGGNLDYLNQFLRTCWKTIHKSFPDAKLTIAGRMPEGSPGLSKIFSEFAKIDFKGYVHSIKELYSGATMAVIPVTKSCGIINKALEAMAAGLCVVGYNAAFSGMPHAIKGIHYEGAQDFDELSRIIIRLLSEHHRMAALGTNARNMMIKEFSWESRAIQYSLLYGAN